MKKSRWVLFFLFFGFAYVNGNPSSSKQNVSIIIPSSSTRGNVKLSSNARILKSAGFDYTSLDGTGEALVLDVDKSVDWHDTYTIIRFKSPGPSKTLDISVTILNKGNADLSLSIDMELPIQSGSIDKLLTCSVYKNKIRLNVNDELVSDFSIGSPSKIVMDLKPDVINPSKVVKMRNSFFKRLDLGSRKGYYRLVLRLDSEYNYKIEKDASDYTIFTL